MKVLVLPNKNVLSVPTLIGELNLGQFLALRKAGASNALEIISILCKQPIEELQAMEFSVRTERQIAAMWYEISEEISRYFSEKNEQERLKKLSTVTVGDKLISIPEDINKYAYWSTRRAKHIIDQELKRIHGTEDKADLTDYYAELLAHYLYCPYTEMKYEENRADEFMEIVNELPVTVAIPLGNFILLGLKKSWYPSKTVLAVQSLKTSARLTLQALKYLGRLLRLTI